MDEYDDFDMNVEEFRELGYSVIDRITKYYSSIRERPVFQKKSAESVANEFDEPLPVLGCEPNELLKEWDEKILPNTTHLGSPRYFGFVNGSGTMIGTLAETLAASVNMNTGAWKASPAGTEIERKTISWLNQLVGYPETGGGLITSGGTMADISAVLTAFRIKADFDSTQDGLQGERDSGKYLIYMSDHEGHVAIERAADMLNLGRSCIRRVPDNGDFRMDVDKLKDMILEDIWNGHHPFCVVAQAGSINVGVIDPLDEIADICEEHDLWFHVDGACGAIGSILPELEEDFRGLYRADSITLDPHKWMCIQYECGCLLVKDQEKLRRTFSMSAPYLRGTMPTEYTGMNYLEYSPQMSRGFKALKLWMTLKHFGVKGYQQLLRQNIRCASYMHELVTQAGDFRAFHEPKIYMYCFQYMPEDIQNELLSGSSKEIEEYLGELNQRIADEIQIEGSAFIMTSRLRGKTVLRLSICSHRTQLSDMELVFQKLRSLGKEIDKNYREVSLA